MARIDGARARPAASLRDQRRSPDRPGPIGSKGAARPGAGRLPGGQAKRFGPAIESTLAAVDADAYQRPDWIDPLTSGQRDQLREAQKTVREIADELGIEPAVIASKKALIPLIRGERPEWLEGWRGEVLTGRFESASVSILAP